MHSRQSGAAHVPLIFFLILMVLFLGALGFAYVSATDSSDMRRLVDEWRVKAAEATARVELRNHYIEDLNKELLFPQVTGENGYQGRTNNVDYKGQTLEGVQGVINPSMVRTKLDEFCSQAGIARRPGLPGVLEAALGRIDALKKQVSQVEADKDKAVAEKEAVDAKFREAGTKHGEAVAAMRADMETTHQAWSSQNEQRGQNIINLQENLNQSRDNLIAEKEANAKVVKEKNAEIAKHQAQNTALVAKYSMVNAPEEADGKIIATKANISQAYIDLGRKDMLIPGTIFEIKGPSSDKVKAHARVVRVEQEKAEVQLYDVVDPVGGQIGVGDRIFNALYSPNQKRNIYLLGRFDYPYHKDQLEKLLVNLGNRIVHKMQPGVDLVILGDKTINEAQDGLESITESPEYKEALILGVEFAPLHKIRHLIQQN